MEFSTAWLSDPEVFSVGRLPACSDHEIFRTEEEADAGASSLIRSLSGMWKAHFALRPADAPDSLLTDGSGSQFDDISDGGEGGGDDWEIL